MSNFASEDWWSKKLHVKVGVGALNPVNDIILDVPVEIDSSHFWNSNEIKEIFYDKDTGGGTGLGHPGPCGTIYQIDLIGVFHGGSAYVVGDIVTFGSATFQVVSILSGGTVVAVGIIYGGNFPTPPGIFFPTGGSGTGLQLSSGTIALGVFPNDRQG